MPPSPKPDPVPDLPEAERQLRNAIYEASRIFETLERAGLIKGNGHHARQKLAQKAVDDLRERWIGPQSKG